MMGLVELLSEKCTEKFHLGKLYLKTLSNLPQQLTNSVTSQVNVSLLVSVSQKLACGSVITAAKFRRQRTRHHSDHYILYTHMHCSHLHTYMHIQTLCVLLKEPKFVIFSYILGCSRH